MVCLYRVKNERTKYFYMFTILQPRNKIIGKQTNTILLANQDEAVKQR